MKKFRMYWDTVKETEWLNSMAREGWNVTGFNMGFYTFEKCEPGEYQYQIDTSDGLWKCSKKYRDFMESVGVEIVCCWGVWVVLRKKTADGNFELYSDDESKLDHLYKILNIYKIVMLIEIGCMSINLYPAFAHNSKMNIFASLFISIFVILFGYMINITKGRINRILENKGENVSSIQKNPRVALSVGWLFLMCAYILNRFFSEYLVMNIICIILGLTAAVFFGLSIRTATKKKSE